MITTEQAQHFATEWINAWNSHNLDEILKHYTADFTIESPLAAIRIPESLGVVSGKEAIRKYWSLGLQHIPDLKFELIEVLTGVNGITLYYLNSATGKRTAEVMWLNNEGKVYKVFAYYSN